MKIPFARPSFSETDEEEILTGIRSVLRSGWLTSGKNVEILEREFCRVVGTKYAVAVNSCTAALHSILLTLELRPRDEVLVPSDTFVATSNAVLYTGAKPVFVDSEPDTFNMSPEDCEDKISHRTKAIIAVHLAGNPCDMKKLSKVAHEHDLELIEDCAHAHGSEFQGSKCGTFGLAGAFSFYATKVVTACEGGVVTTNDQSLAERVKRIRNQGRGGYGPQEITELGFNYRMSDVQGVIGLSQLRHLPQFVEERGRIAAKYNNAFSNMKWLSPQLVKKGDICSYYVYLIRLAANSPVKRDELMKRLGDKGIGTSILYHPAHRQPFYSQILYEDPGCPVAVELGNTTLALPMYNGMSDEEFGYVIRECKETMQMEEGQYASTN